MGLKVIPINQIKENPVALRPVNRNHENYHGLVDSIKKLGVLNPISVREVKDPDNGEIYYSIVDGLHRFTGANDAGLEEIPANVISISDGEVLEAQIMGNIHKFETKPAEYAKQLLRILTGNPFLTINELAARLGKSPAWLQNMLNLTKLPDNILKLIDEGKVKLANAYALSKLPTEEEQVNFLDRAMTMEVGEFMGVVQNRVKELRDDRRKGREASPEQFSAQPHLQKLADIKTEMDQPDNIRAIIAKNKITDPSVAAQEALKWTLHLDEFSVAVAKAKWEAGQKEKAEAKAKRDKDRLEAKEKKAREEAEKAREELSKIG